MRVSALAAAFTIAAASLCLSGCTSRGLIYPGYSAPPQYSGYSGAPYAPAAVVYPEYGVPPPEAPPISAYGAYLPPRAACAQVWSCGYRGCGWQPSCAPGAQPYARPYGPPRPQVYSDHATPPEPYTRRYRPQDYSGPARPYSGEQTYGSAYRQ
jgi:hypothetical protein